MAKYSPEFKLMIVNEYLDGPLGYKLLAKKYNIPNESPIKNWVRQYKKNGMNGLSRKQSQQYTGEFKLNVLNYMKTTGASYSMTADYFNISETGTIANWKSILLTKGSEALFKPKGRPPKTMKSNNKKNNKTLTREQQLEEEIKLLRIENEYLKKCRALGIQPWDHLTNSKQKSSKS